MCAPSSSSTEPINKTNSAKLVGGTWTFTYTIVSTFSDTYSLASVDAAPNSSGNYLVRGADAYGGLVVGGYKVNGPYWDLLDPETLIDKYYTFTFIDTNHVSGCFYLVNPPGSTNPSRCYSMTGSRSPLQPLAGKGFASSVTSPPHKSDPDAIMREVANDTVPGFIEQGVVDAYLTHRKEIQ